MDWTSVNSSLINAVAYDEQSQELLIEFHQGRRYSYSGVDPQTAAKLIEAGSVGQFFNRAIRHRYPTTEI